MKNSNWVLYRSAAYLGGKGITFGEGVVPPSARAANKFSIQIDVMPGSAAMVGEDLGTIADGSCDHVFVGKRLESLYEPSKLLKQATAKVKVGGHLLVNLLEGHVEPGYRDFYPEQIKSDIAQLGKWALKAEYNQGGEFLLIYKRLEGKRGVEDWTTKHSGKRRALIARYGQIGDAIIMSPLIRALAEDGYEVTVNATPYCLAPLENNPYISNVIIQERDMVPNLELKQYWDTWSPEYDRYINLSESLEGTLLKVEGRPEFYTTQSWRSKMCDVNYYDRTMKLGGYEEKAGLSGELYPTQSEERQIKKILQPFDGKFTVMWALNGSSHHKIYPLMESVLVEWFRERPDVQVITVGDDTARLMEFEHPQVLCQAGQLPLRLALLMTKYVGCVVGPETAITNAAGCWDTPKITLLSHSTHENLCKYWKNDYCLAPDKRLAACYPCHQLHYSRESCPQGIMIDDDTGTVLASGALCQMGQIRGEVVLDRLNEVYTKHFKH